MLQEAAAEMNDWNLVNNISGECYKSIPSPEIALRAAKGAAAGQNLEAAIGWLSAAKDGGVENISEFIQDPIFDPFREEPSFTKFQG